MLLILQNSILQGSRISIKQFKTTLLILQDSNLQHGDGCKANCDQSSHTGLQVCSLVWTRVRNTLPEHVQEFARNIEILRKSKDDVDVDMAERTASASAMQIAFNPDLDETEDVLDDSVQINSAVDDNT